MAKTPYTQKEARAGLSRSLADLDAGPDDASIRAHCPEAWQTLEEDVEVREKKVHVTLRLDESVAAYFLAMGQGYQARISRILKTYAQMRVAKVSALEREGVAAQPVVADPAEKAAADGMRQEEACARIMARWEELRRMTPEERDAERQERERRLAELGLSHRSKHEE